MASSKYEEIKKAIEEKGYALITKEFDSAWTKWTKLDIRCLNNHDLNISAQSIINGSTCKECAKQERLNQIRLEFEAIGYKLLSFDFSGKRPPLDYKCDMGHRGTINYVNFSKGVRCTKCNKKKRPTYELVKSEFEAADYILLSKTYTKSVDKLDVICPNGHEIKLSYNKFSCGRVCVKCSGRYRMTYDEIVELYASRGYELLSPKEEYESVRSILKFKCANNHLNEMSPNAITQGRTCSVCTGNKKLTYDFVRDKFKKRGFTLITTTYTNARTMMKYICDKGKHTHKMTYDDMRSGGGCGKCSGKAKLEYSFVQKAFAKVGYTLLTKEFKNSHQKLTIKCDKGHVSAITYTHFKSSGRRCPLCSQSNGEIAVREHLTTRTDIASSVNEKTFSDCKDVGYLFFDYHVTLNSDVQFVIEFDGRQHFEVVEFFGGRKGFESTQKRDKIKTKYCRDKKIPLLRISYRHLKNVSSIIESFITDLDDDPEKIHFTDPDLYAHLM